MLPIQQISSLINCLTKDEDLRQDLWVHYLSGNSIDSFSAKLEILQSDFSDDTELKKAVWAMFKQPPSDVFFAVLEEFSEFERSIMCMLAIGLSIEQISAYKGINQVRVRQAIASIRYNIVWDKHYGFEKKS